MNIEDIGVVLQHMNLKIESKRPAEEPEDAKLRRFKERWLFIATLIALAIRKSRIAPNFILSASTPTPFHRLYQWHHGPYGHERRLRALKLALYFQW